jgi:hypothetical protein
LLQEVVSLLVNLNDFLEDVLRAMQLDWEISEDTYKEILDLLVDALMGDKLAAQFALCVLVSCV